MVESTSGLGMNSQKSRDFSREEVSRLAGLLARAPGWREGSRGRGVAVVASVWPGRAGDAAAAVGPPACSRLALSGSRAKAPWPVCVPDLSMLPEAWGHLCVCLSPSPASLSSWRSLHPEAAMTLFPTVCGCFTEHVQYWGPLAPVLLHPSVCLRAPQGCQHSWPSSGRAH